ncbi:MAG TPA: NAD-dependent epimerase/dehydratase family protein [Trueperaceae bacterium]
MKVLVIGGSYFVGKHFVEQALAKGHELTLFNRGNRPAPPGVVSIEGDRNGDLSELEQGKWDVVLDTCGYFPRQTSAMTAALDGRVEHYAFVSTISVYSDQSKPYQDESAPTIVLEDPTVEEITAQSYGGLKKLCEETVEAAFGSSCLIVRPGLIVGPDDPSDRFTYWPVRVAEGGEVLAPGSPELPVQWIDVRDLAAWLLLALERRLSGTFNAVSEPDRFELGQTLDTCRLVSGSDARFTWVDEQFLLEREVQPFIEMPLWIPGDHVNFSRVDGGRAIEQGLVIRGAEDTVRATLEWHRRQEAREPRAGMSREREAELLSAWNARESVRS